MRFYILLVFCCVSASTLAQVSGSDTTSAGKSSVIGYPTVQAALEDLKSKPGVQIQITQPDGWTIVNEPAAFVQWSFTPPGHSAYPAVVRRTINENSSGIYITMAALCQADKSACDKLIVEFKEMNEHLRESFGRQSKR